MKLKRPFAFRKFSGVNVTILSVSLSGGVERVDVVFSQPVIRLGDMWPEFQCKTINDFQAPVEIQQIAANILKLVFFDTIEVAPAPWMVTGVNGAEVTFSDNTLIVPQGGIIS